MRFLGLVLLGVTLLFLTSQISIPIEPIPITFQTVGVMLIGLAYSRGMAALIVLLYLILGALDIPIFANFTGGLQKLFGPSGGYLWGFLAAVILMTTLKRYLNYRVLSHIIFNCLSGTAIILIIGVGWLAFYIGFAAAIKSGFYPFIILGVIKIFLTSLIFYFSNRFLLDAHVD